jgi:hypothetical protein
MKTARGTMPDRKKNSFGHQVDAAKILSDLRDLYDKGLLSRYITEIQRLTQDVNHAENLREIFSDSEFSELWLSAATYYQQVGNFHLSETYFARAYDFAENSLDVKQQVKVLRLWADLNLVMADDERREGAEQKLTSAEKLLKRQRLYGAAIHREKGRLLFFLAKYHLQRKAVRAEKIKQLSMSGKYIRQSKAVLETALKLATQEGSTDDIKWYKASLRKTLILGAQILIKQNRIKYAHKWLAGAEPIRDRKAIIDEMFLNQTLLELAAAVSGVQSIKAKLKKFHRILIKAEFLSLELLRRTILMLLDADLINEANECLDLALSTIEKSRKKISAPELQAKYHRKWALFYRLKRNLHLKRGEPEKAIILQSQNMGRYFADRVLYSIVEDIHDPEHGTELTQKLIREQFNSFFSEKPEVVLVFPIVRKLDRKPEIIAVRKSFQRKNCLVLTGQEVDQIHMPGIEGETCSSVLNKAFASLAEELRKKWSFDRAIVLPDRYTIGVQFHSHFMNLREPVAVSYNWSVPLLAQISKRSSYLKKDKLHVLRDESVADINTEEEWNIIRQTLGKKNVKRDVLNRKNLLKAFEESAMIHIIGHADAKNIYAGEPGKQESILNSDELLMMKIKSKWVMISGCKAGRAEYRGAKSKGVENEPEGLMMSLLFAGAKFVLAPTDVLYGGHAIRISSILYKNLLFYSSDPLKAWKEFIIEMKELDGKAGVDRACNFRLAGV